MQIQPADRQQRRRATAILAAVAIVLIVLLFAFNRWLHHAAQTMDTPQLIDMVKHLLGVCVIMATACLLLIGRHLLLRGRRIVRDRRYPANDARPLRDTPVREGDEAVRIGNTSRIAGLIVCLLGVSVAVVGWFWIAQFG